MQPANVRVNLWQGGDRTKTWAFAFKDPTTGAITYPDFTGCLVRLQIKASRNGSLPALLSMDSASVGGITLSTQPVPGGSTPSGYNAISADFTAAKTITPGTGLAPGHYTFEVFVDDWPSSNLHAPLILGDLHVFATGTRP